MSELKSASSLGWWALSWWAGFFFWAWVAENDKALVNLIFLAFLCFWGGVITTMRWMWRRHTIRKARIQAEAMAEVLASRQVVMR